MLTEQDRQDLQDLITNTGAAHVRVDRSTLGGEERASLMILVILDPKETWANGIMENSRYARFSIHSDQKIEYFSGSIRVPFRKGKVKDMHHAAKRINEFIAQALQIQK